MDYRAHGILQARILEWVAFPFSRGSSQLTTKAFFRKEPKSWFICHLPHSSAPNSICLHFRILHIFSKTKGGKIHFLDFTEKKKKRSPEVIESIAVIGSIKRQLSFLKMITLMILYSGILKEMFPNRIIPVPDHSKLSFHFSYIL